MAVWPSSLPQSPRVQGYSGSVSDVRARTKMDQGPDKIRRRHTAKTSTFSMSMILTTAQMGTLFTFYDTTLNGGADAFTWKHPRTDVAASMRFVSTIRESAAGPDLYDASFVVEIIPS